jgi:hypothetical protein
MHHMVAALSSGNRPETIDMGFAVVEVETA